MRVCLLQIRNMVIQIIFSVTFALSCTMFELIIFEIVGILGTRYIYICVRTYSWQLRYLRYSLELQINFHLQVIVADYGAEDVHCISHLRSCNYSVHCMYLLAYDFLSSFTYPMISCTHPVTSNLPKSLVYRRLHASSETASHF